MFVCLVDNLNSIEAGLLPNVSPGLYFRGFVFWNSEVGVKTTRGVPVIRRSDSRRTGQLAPSLPGFILRVQIKRADAQRDRTGNGRWGLCNALLTGRPLLGGCCATAWARQVVRPVSHDAAPWCSVTTFPTTRLQH